MRFFASFEETEPLPVLVVGAQVETKEVSLVLDELVELARNELSRADKFGDLGGIDPRGTRCG